MLVQKQWSDLLSLNWWFFKRWIILSGYFNTLFEIGFFFISEFPRRWSSLIIVSWLHFPNGDILLSASISHKICWTANTASVRRQTWASEVYYMQHYYWTAYSPYLTTSRWGRLWTGSTSLSGCAECRSPSSQSPLPSSSGWKDRIEGFIICTILINFDECSLDTSARLGKFKDFFQLCFCSLAIVSDLI